MPLVGRAAKAPAINEFVRMGKNNPRGVENQAEAAMIPEVGIWGRRNLHWPP